MIERHGTVGWLLDQDSAEAIRRRLNSRFASRRAMLGADDRIRLARRHNSDVTGRVGTLLEFGLVEVIDSFDDAWDAPARIAYNVATAFPDLWIRRPDLSIAAGLEVKSVYVGSGERSANADWLVAQTRPDDLMVVVAWDWEPDRPESIRYPHATDVAVVEARWHVRLRDAHWLASDPSSARHPDLVRQSVRPKGHFFVRTRGGQLVSTEEGGNVGKIGRRSGVTPRAVAGETLAREERLRDLLGRQPTARPTAATTSILATNRVTPLGWHLGNDSAGKSVATTSSRHSVWRFDASVPPDTLRRLVERLIPARAAGNGTNPWPADGLGTLTVQHRVERRCGMCAGCLQSETCETPKASLTHGAYDVDLFVVEASTTPSGPLTLDPTQTSYRSSRAFVLLPTSRKVDTVSVTLANGVTNATVAWHQDRDYRVSVTLDDITWRGIEVPDPDQTDQGLTAAVRFAMHSSGQEWSEVAWGLQRTLDLADLT